MADFDAELRNLTQVLESITDARYVGEPLRRFLNKWAYAVHRGTVRNFERGPGGWIDTAETRRSFAVAIDPSSVPLYARVGSGLDKARWGDYGTGLLSEDPNSNKQRHYPPAKALDGWAERKQIQIRVGTNKNGEPIYRIATGADIARMIGRRGGLAPRRYLRDAAERVEEQIPAWIRELVADIERTAGQIGQQGAA